VRKTKEDFFLRNKKESNSQEIPQLKFFKPCPTPDALIQAVSEESGAGWKASCEKAKRGI
jgi:hypothetical protein